MKNTFIIIMQIFALISCTKYDSNAPEFNLSVERVNGGRLPKLHSFAYAQYESNNHQYLFVVGGSGRGLHQFDGNDSAYNQAIYLLDLDNKKIVARVLLSLIGKPDIEAQLGTVSSEFFVKGNYLYYIGGLSGYIDKSYNFELKTFPNITQIDYKHLSNDMLSGKINNHIGEYFRQVYEPKLQITGGVMGRINNSYYIGYGQNFSGIYNPDDSSQEGIYIPYITKFIVDESSNNFIRILSQESNLSAIRRRDSNIWPISQSTELHNQFLISAGPFQPKSIQVYLTPILISPNNPQESKIKSLNFSQNFNQYIASTISMFSEKKQKNYLITLGGASINYLSNGKIVYQQNAPLSNIISLLSGSGTNWVEFYDEQPFMPYAHYCTSVISCFDTRVYTGMSSTFILDSLVPVYTENEQINYDKLLAIHHSESKIFLGYMYGGLISPERNTFGTNSSNASSDVYKVYLIIGTSRWQNIKN